MALFDRYIVVDWSAANAPKRGADSIWIGAARRARAGVEAEAPVNPPTREDAMARLYAAIDAALGAGERVFAGFDFPFGYPQGAATRIAGAPRWSALWSWLAGAVRDDGENRSNRFEIAARVNREAFGEPVFWGRPASQPHDGLPARRAPSALRDAMAFRRAEAAHPPAKSAWQLAYAGAVGSQAMLGIARLNRLTARYAGRVAVWPFETGFDDDLCAPLVLAEVYPSLFDIAPAAGEPRDSAQVRTLARHFAEQDAHGAFRARLAAPAGLALAARRAILEEEGWIVGPGTAKRGAAG